MAIPIAREVVRVSVGGRVLCGGMKPINSLPKRQQSTSRIDRTANPKDDPRVEVWSDPRAAGNPQVTVDAKGNHFEITGGQLSLGKTVSETWFAANDLNVDIQELESRHKQQIQRMWMIDRGQDVNPSDLSLGAEVGHYADSTVDMEVVSNFARFKHHLADTCLQQLEVPEYVRNHVLYLIHNRDLMEFNQYGGINGAIVGFTTEALAEFLSLRKMADLKDTPWWPDIKSLADEFGIIGATGRQFRQLIDHVEENYELPR